MKEKDLGGNSAKATSGINACATRVQKQNGVSDDCRFLERDTFVSAKGGSSDQGCVAMLASKSAEARPEHRGFSWPWRKLGQIGFSYTGPCVVPTVGN